MVKNKMKLTGHRTNSLCLGILLAVCTAPLAHSQVLVYDDFSDGERLTQNLPGSLHWYTGGATNATVSNRTMMFAADVGGSTPNSIHGGALAYFTAAGSPLTLTVGQSLTLSFAYSYSNLDSGDWNFRFGFFNSGGLRTATDNSGFNNAIFNGYTGYLATGLLGPDTSGLGRYKIAQRNLTANNLLTTTSYSILGGNVKQTAGTNFGQTYSASLTVNYVNATNMILTSVIAGQTLVRTNLSGLTTNFDTVGIFAPGTPGNVTISNVRIALTPMATSLTLASSANPGSYHSALTFTANVTPVNIATATGSIVFSTTNGPFSTNTLSAGSATSLSLATLPHGTNTVTAVYLGDNNYLSTTNTFAQVIANSPPVANAMTLTRGKGQTIKVALSDLATNWTDVDGAPVTLTGMSQTSTNGRTLYALNFTANSDGSYVITNTAFIGYLNPSNVTDRFSYSIRDGNGNTNIGYVNVVVSASPMFGQTTGIFSAPSQPVLLNFLGHPGYSYNVQRSTNLVTWSTIWTTNAPPAGPFSYPDSFADLGGRAPSSAYYRLSWNP